MSHVEPALVRREHRLLLLVGLALLVAVGLVVWRELRPAWKGDQERARALVEARLGAARAAKLPDGFLQTWIPQLGRVDRCVICHVGIEEGPDLAGLPHPARSHPRPELLAVHPVERFGCTLCHGGQGSATDKAAAHGDAPFWDEPLLDAKRAATYGLTAAELMEMRCNTCHRDQAEVAGMPLMNAAKALFKERKCSGCHAVKGVGGTEGPDLSWVGDVPYEQRHFPEGFTAQRTAIAWHAAHIREPAALVPGSTMRQYRFDPRQALSLALLVSSWRRVHLPPEWLPR